MATALVVTLIVGTPLAAFASNQKECKAKEAEYTGTCTIDWNATPPKCNGQKNRTTYDNVGVCKAKEDADCPASTESGTYTEATADCVMNSAGNACHTPSWGPESDPEASNNPECNP